MFAMVFYLPVYLQLALGSNPAESGLLLLPLTGGIVGGARIDRPDHRLDRPADRDPEHRPVARRAVPARPGAAAAGAAAPVGLEIMTGFGLGWSCR